MAVDSVINYEALTAWSTLAAAIATFSAVAVALWQSLKARRDLRMQLEHQNWLEQKHLEEQHLGRMIEIVHRPYTTSQDFYFSMLRLLGPVALGLPTPDGFDDQVRQTLDSFAGRTSDSEAVVGNYLDIISALRELHGTRGDAEAATTYEKLVTEVRDMLNAASSLREWLADPHTILSINPEKYFDLPLVGRARDTANATSRSIARQIVRLYETPSSA
jgi:hypothetical protein